MNILILQGPNLNLLGLKSSQIKKQLTLGKLNSLIHEIVGVVVYRVTGRTNSFFPDLENIPIN